MKITNTRFYTALGGARWAALLVFCSVFFFQSGTGSLLNASNSAPMVWSVTSHQGKHIESSALLGRVTIVNFWATYCIPCIVEIPTFQNLAQKYQKNGLAVVGVSVDGSSPAMLKAFVDRFKMSYTVAMGNPGVMSNFGVSDTVPMTFVIDPQGKVVRRYEGRVNKDELEKQVRLLLKL